MAFLNGVPSGMPEEIGFVDFSGVASTRINGEQPVVVGGQAVNIWALFYLPRIETELRPHAPFVSKDLDLYGSRQVIEGLAKGRGKNIAVFTMPSPYRVADC